ncbi:MAG: hypothetical protein AAF487_15370 [Bacteroidota bacterium]
MEEVTEEYMERVQSLYQNKCNPVEILAQIQEDTSAQDVDSAIKVLSTIFQFDFEAFCTVFPNYMTAENDELDIELIKEIEFNRFFWRKEGKSEMLRNPDRENILELRDMYRKGIRPVEMIRHIVLNRRIWPPLRNRNHCGLVELFRRAFSLGLGGVSNLPEKYMERESEIRTVNELLEMEIYSLRADWDHDFACVELVKNSASEAEIRDIREDFLAGRDVTKIMDEFSRKRWGLAPVNPLVEDAFLIAFQLHPEEAAYCDAVDIGNEHKIEERREMHEFASDGYGKRLYSKTSQTILTEYIEARRTEWQDAVVSIVKKEITDKEVAVLRSMYKQGASRLEIVGAIIDDKMIEPPLLPFCAYALVKAFYISRSVALAIIASVTLKSERLMDVTFTDAIEETLWEWDFGTNT